MLLRDFPEHGTSAAGHADTAASTVLVVDDFEPQRYAVTRTLRVAGYTVLEAESGEAALAITRTQSIGAAVVDVGLPGIDGLGVCRALKRQSPILPVLLVTARSISPEMMEDALAAGADAYLEHPVEPTHVRALVGALVRMRAAAEAAVVQLRANSLLQDALDALVDHVALLDHDGAIVAVNRAWTDFGRANGYPDAGGGLGENYVDVCDRSTDPSAREIGGAIREILAGRREAFEAVYSCHAPDEPRWFGLSVRAMHRAGIDRVAAIVLHTDRTSQVLRQAVELRFKAFVEASREIIWGIDRVGRTTYVNPGVSALCGYDPEELLGRPLADFLEPGGCTLETLYTLMPAEHIEASLRTRSGERLDVTVIFCPIKDSIDGTTAIAVLADNSQRKTAERQLIDAVEALRVTEQRLRDQFARLPVATFLYECAGDDFLLVDANDAGVAMLASTRGHRIGDRASVLFPAAWSIRADFDRCLAEGVVLQRRGLRYVESDLAEERTFDLSIGPQPPDRILVHVVETTEQTRLAGELRQAQKMEAVGRLAGGIAHDFNNLLTVIGASCTFLLDQLPTDSELRSDADAIQSAADRAATLTRHLLAFSRKQLLAPALIDVNAVVAGAYRLLQRILGEDIAFTLELSPEPQVVLADAGQLEQVLMNLAVNARDAMMRGGRLAITTRSRSVDRDAGLPHYIAPGRYVCLTVRDDGVGMSPETRARAFEPFFTTKEPGEGTGLGLSTVYGIIKQSNGYVTVESAPGDGTVFEIFLPAVARGTDAAHAPVSTGPADDASPATILLVEDDDYVRQIASRILERDGHRLIEAKNGLAAIALARSTARPIDLVLTDAVMPGMSGIAVIDEVRALHPSARAIIMSGYTDDEMARRGICAADVAFIQKPFLPTALTRRVRQVLTSSLILPAHHA